MKELLSEHLCAVIQHNEARKSRKLEELMSKLQMDGSSSEERSGGAKADNRSATDVAGLLKTPTPGMDVWPALAKKQRNSATTTTTNRYSNSSALRHFLFCSLQDCMWLPRKYGLCVLIV